MSATVQARGESASHGDRELFAGLDLVVAPGDVIGLVGPNGAGKTTLLRLLAGVREPDGGTISVSPASAHIGYLTQEPETSDDETVRGHLTRRTGVLAAQLEFDRQSAALADDQEFAADSYSAARVGLAVLLLARFDAYLLDEPTNNLDSRGLEMLEEFVGGLDAPVVVVSHDREFLARTVTTVVEIDRSLQQITT